jgi:hypothetical protein
VSVSYDVNRAAVGGITAMSLSRLASLLLRDDWPAGTYRIVEHTWSAPAADAAVGRAWGSAIKHRGGAIDLIRDGEAP